MNAVVNYEVRFWDEAIELGGYLLDVIRRKGVRSSDEQDVLQEVYKDCAKAGALKRAELVESKGIRPWMVKIAKCRTVDQIRRQIVRKERQCEHALESLESTVNEEIWELIWKAVDLFPVECAQHKIAIEKKYIEGLSNKDIGAILELTHDDPANKVSKLLAEARTMLGDQLKQWGYDLEPP